ncbi:MAG: putative oxidoreductase [Rhodospirillaceae bacterium]|nr:putative oxidoreductase [Rhodospirillaceae bacterium]
MAFNIFDRLAEQSRGNALLVSRVLMALIYVNSGFGKLTNFTGFAEYLAGKGVPAATVLAILAVAAEFLGGLCVLLGLWTRPAALVLFVFTGFAAVIGHPFWAADAASYQSQFINFMKNLSIMGGFLTLFVAGAGPISVDAKVSRRR